MCKLEQVSVRLKICEKKPIYSVQPIRTSDDAISVIAEEMKSMDREHLVVLNMDAGNRPINYSVVSVGSTEKAVVDAKNVFKPAILTNASAIIMLHNHPSGSLSPSQCDEDVTESIAKAGRILGVQLLDHIIVGGVSGECYSFFKHKPNLFKGE